MRSSLIVASLVLAAPDAATAQQPAGPPLDALRELLATAGTVTLNANTRYAVRHMQSASSVDSCTVALRVDRDLELVLAHLNGRLDSVDLRELSPRVQVVRWEAERVFIVTVRSRTGNAGIKSRVLPVVDTTVGDPRQEASVSLLFRQRAPAQSAAAHLAAAIRSCGGRVPSAAEESASAKREAAARRAVPQQRWTVEVSSLNPRQMIVGSLTYSRGGKTVTARVSAVTPHTIELKASRLALTLGDTASSGRFRVVVTRDGRAVYDESWVAPYGGISAVMPRS